MYFKSLKFFPTEEKKITETKIEELPQALFCCVEKNLWIGINCKFLTKFHYYLS